MQICYNEITLPAYILQVQYLDLKYLDVKILDIETNYIAGL